MTPKDKAMELIDKYYIICQEYTEEIQCSIQAKQCALIAVDEILDLSIGHFDDLHPFVNFWQQVKQEIINQ